MINLDKVTKTRCGYEVLMAKYFPNNAKSRKIIAVIRNEDGIFAHYYHDNGRFSYYTTSPKDLTEDKQEITKWCNVYKDVKEGGIYGTAKLYDTKEQAIRCHDTFCSYIKAVPITVKI